MMRNERVRAFQPPSGSNRQVGFVAYKPFKKRMKTTHRLLIVLGILVVVLVGIEAIKRLAVSIPSGTGSVAGMAVDENSAPVRASISILKTQLVVQAGVDGNFRLDGAPAGAQHVIIAYQGMGQDIPVVIEAGKTVQIGTIKLVTTQMP